MANPYVINFEHLGLGQHEFQFDVDRKLFEEAASMDLLDAQFTVDLLMHKGSNMMDLHFEFNGSFTVPCDRCNSPLTLPISDKGSLVIKYGQAEHEEFDELIVLAANEYQINLTHYFYETISLFMPQRRVHDEKDCDPAYLKLITGAEYPANESGETEADPRWDKLKQIK